MTKCEFDITQLLADFSDGDKNALNELWPVLNKELHRIASIHIRRENSGITLKTTDLVHDAYLKLINQDVNNLQNRAHFYAIAGQIMRNILIDYARKRKAEKRGGNIIKISLENITISDDVRFEEWLDVDEALKKLELFDKRKSKIVELRYFSGLTIEETAYILGISTATVKRDWTMAKAWLARELGELNKDS